MTTLTAHSITRREHTVDPGPARSLRAVLTANAVTAFAGGALGLAAAPLLSDELGFDHVTLTRIIGIGLMVFALTVALLARSRAERMVTWSTAVSAADLAWVAATATLIATGTLTTTGIVVAAGVGIVVLDFAVLQLWFRSCGRAG